MQAITTIGLDIAKSMFQVHGIAQHWHRRSDAASACRQVASSLRILALGRSEGLFRFSEHSSLTVAGIRARR